MLNNIFGILEKIGFGAQKRAINVRFSNAELNSQIMLQRIDGYHGINDGLSAELICLSTNPYIELKQFIGCQVAIDQVTDAGQLFRTTGIVTGASQGQSDGAFSLYRLTMQDATSLWRKRRNSRVFMNKSVVDIIEVIFKEWQSKSPLFASSLQLDTSGLTKTYDVRPFSMQSNESDYAYLTRIMREESINWLVDEASYLVASNSQSIEAQKLRLIDDNTQFQSLERRTIRYHRSNATEQYDSITSFIAQRQLQPTAIHVQRWQADSLSQEDASGSVVSSHQHSTHRDNESLSLEQAWNISPAWISDLKGEDQATASSNSQLEKLNMHLNQYQALQAKYFTAHSSVRDTQVGYWFQLHDYPELEKNHSQQDKEFLILNKHFYNQNNLPKDIQDQVEKLLTLSHWQNSKDSEQERQANEFVVVRRNINVVPEYDPLKHRPVAHVQRAKVVSDGEEIHVDEWGRIKVRFLFTRTDDHAHDGGAGANNSDTDSAWVDVLTPWAGEGYGARFLPRKDEIVVIDFFDGNIDRPFVTGRIHEAQRSPTKFDIKGQLPDTKKLSGIRSKEVDGSGYNQLRFDDTTGQISAQLHSSHGSSQLNLGNLSHPKDKAESEGRGQGFELRTDEWGAIRAAKGILLTSESSEQAQGEQLTRSNIKENINFHTESNKYFKELASAHEVDEPDLGSQDSLKEKFDKWNESSDALVALHSESAMILDSKESLQLAAKQNIDVSTPKNLQFFTGKSWIAKALDKISIFAKHAGIKIKSGEGDVEIAAQKGKMTLSSKKQMHVYSLNDFVRIESGKGILITAGGGYIKIQDGNIEIACPGLMELKAGQIQTKGGVSLSSQLPAMPELKSQYDEHFILHYPDGEPAKNLKYRITAEDGQVFEGVSGEDGKTTVFTKDAMTALNIEVFSPE
ncbi:type VI secretion system Vgr family protein [Acinetobacter baumannii]|uniref:type VI secretion system Vgr family protein n=1 Tax=Acinetobacter baumannii TaxID=470 RepID=UPI002340D168|nr:type VI secretion system Vgr family protein [Acinetobacter baumannii]MDC4584785.1 type VI secretion system tip protein VgrG [Acinetobacter baumannii]MDC4608069.1 type VI secretion system tip protein VgrG [Acinetobacter baumannii]MDK2130860.1 type VI secretion system Vgr family protein [Acinetobacter baumannii]MDK2161554.1 type VI secretion system Vgr family protein [Acinetobacter baumannii]MDK2169039.1 type VI secretion system Vgr family protein [Acinetobacter baumannii]